MKPNLVVFTDFSPAAERARAYAAMLAEAVGAELHLVHVFLPMTMTTETGVVVPYVDEQYAPETRRHLTQLAATLPVPATTDLIEADWSGAVEQALRQYQPLLLVAGLTATSGPVDEWLSNRAIPLARQTGYPLLLVPEHLPAQALSPPCTVVLAVEDRPFALNPNARRVAPLLDALACDIITVTVLPSDESTGGWDALRAAQRCGLAKIMLGCGLHKVVGERPASGILQATKDLSADVLALVDQDHGLLHKVFSGSVIDHVLRHTPVPVLLLAGHLTPWAA